MRAIPETYKKKINFILKPIILILIVAFVVRLIEVTSPPLSWRQADTAAIARNFFENRFNILFPQIDWGGNSLGYAETEFPVYSFAVASLYKIFGLHEYLARLLSISFSLAGIFFLYRLAKEIWGEKCALWAAVFFAFLPLQMHISKSIMPEPMMIMCMIAGVYYFFMWSRKPRLSRILLSAAFLSIAVSIKPPTLYLLLPLGYLAWLRFRFRLVVNPHLWLFGIILIVPSILWYYHAHQLYLQTGLTFGIWGYGTDKWGLWSLPLTGEFWRVILWGHLAHPLAYFGVPIVIAGMLFRKESKEELFIDYWIVALLAYIVIVSGGNYAHEYYLLPAIVPASLLMGMVYGKQLKGYRQWFNPKQVLLLMSLAGMLVSSLIIYSAYIEQNDPSSSMRLKLGNYVQTHTDSRDLVVVIDDSDPALLYLSHRKGWRSLSNVFRVSDIPKYKEWGASYVIGFNNDGPFMFDVNAPTPSARNLLPANF